MQLSENGDLVTTATTLAVAVNLGISVIRDVVGDALPEKIEGVNVHTDVALAGMFTAILNEELKLNPNTRL